jgi:hypothetical protein
VSGLVFFTSSQARLSINVDGSIGVGTTEPTRTVEIHHDGDVELRLAEYHGRRTPLDDSKQ